MKVAGVSKLLASLGCTGRRVVLVHTLNTQTLTKTDERKNVLSKHMILCWATFIAILDHMQPAGRELDTPAPKCHKHRMERACVRERYSEGTYGT